MFGEGGGEAEKKSQPSTLFFSGVWPSLFFLAVVADLSDDAAVVDGKKKKKIKAKKRVVVGADYAADAAVVVDGSSACKAEKRVVKPFPAGKPTAPMSKAVVVDSSSPSGEKAATGEKKRSVVKKEKVESQPAAKPPTPSKRSSAKEVSSLPDDQTAVVGGKRYASASDETSASSAKYRKIFYYKGRRLIVNTEGCDTIEELFKPKKESRWHPEDLTPTDIKNLKSAQQKLGRFWKDGIFVSVNQAGEAMKEAFKKGSSDKRQTLNARKEFCLEDGRSCNEALHMKI